MKLDKDVIREVLLAVEASDTDPYDTIDLELPGRSREEVSYTVMLLAEAGLLVAEDLSSLGDDGFGWVPMRLTFAGHEFLDTVRDGEIWRRTKEGAAKVGVASVQVLLEIGKAYAKQAIREHLGFTVP